MAGNHYFCMNYGLPRCGTVRKDIAVPKTPTKFSISGIGGLVQAQFIFIPIQKLGGNENDNMRLPVNSRRGGKKMLPDDW